MAIEEGHFTYNHTFAQLPSVHTKSCKHVAQVRTDDQNGIVTKMVLSIGDFIKIPSHSLSKSSTNGRARAIGQERIGQERLANTSWWPSRYHNTLQRSNRKGLP